MKKFWYVIKIIVLILFVGFAAIQFIPRTYNQSAAILPTDLTKTYDVPSDVQKILQNSCYDCHSNNTNYPWYSVIQPAARFMEGHIIDGKKELNFSEFGDYSKRRQKTKFKSIVSQIRDDEMPLPSYTYIHWNAILDVQDKEKIVGWIDSLDQER